MNSSRETHLSQDIFVRDLIAGTNTVVSLISGSQSGRTNYALKPCI